MKRVRYSILALALILMLGSGSVLTVCAVSREDNAAADIGATNTAGADNGAADSAAAKKSLTEIITSVGTTQAFKMEEVPEEVAGDGI